MRCSIGVLELPKGLVIDDISRVGTAIAAIKTKAKRVAAAWSSIRSAMLASRDQLPPFSLAPSIVLRAELCPCLRGRRPRGRGEPADELPTDMRYVALPSFGAPEAMTIARGPLPVLKDGESSSVWKALA